MKYRKKPVEVEAVQWDGRDETYQEIKKMNGGEVYRAGVWDNELGIAITTHSKLFYRPASPAEAPHGRIPARS